MLPSRYDYKSVTVSSDASRSSAAPEIDKVVAKMAGNEWEHYLSTPWGTRGDCLMLHFRRISGPITEITYSYRPPSDTNLEKIREEIITALTCRHPTAKITITADLSRVASVATSSQFGEETNRDVDKILATADAVVKKFSQQEPQS